MSGPPPDPTPLEYLADDAGLGPEDLRKWLRAEIARRQRPGSYLTSPYDERRTRTTEATGEAAAAEDGGAEAGSAESVGAGRPAEEHAHRARRAAA